LKKFFDDYEGDDNFDKAMEFVEKEFKKKNHNDPDRIKIYHLTALNNEDFENCFSDILKYLDKQYCQNQIDFNKN